MKPPFCDRCGLPVCGEIRDNYTCSNCKDIEPDFDSARSAVFTSGIVRKIIHKYKYGTARCLEPYLVKLFLPRALPELSGQFFSGVVPIPLHAVKERERGFNQALPLAQSLSVALNIPLLDNYVDRVKDTHPQTNLTRAARKENVRGAFHVRRGAILGTFPVIIIDDVMTTGATVSSCAKALRRAGAIEVRVWTLARAHFDAVFA